MEQQMTGAKSGSPRQYYLDWVRVMVILTVFIYHSARFFNLDGWHIKNAVTYWGVELWEQLLATWLWILCHRMLCSRLVIWY